MLKAVLFDLDGTLLPMDEPVFIDKYGELLAEKLSKLGYDRLVLSDAFWKGFENMYSNDGSKTNGEVFWNTFTTYFGDDAIKYKEIVLDYFANEFLGTKCKTEENPLAKTIVNFVKENNLYNTCEICFNL